MDHRLLVEHSVDVIFQVRQMSDGEMLYQYVSPSAADVLGWTAKEMEGVTHSMIYPPASLVLIKEAGRRLVKGAPSTLVTVEAIRKDGTHIWVENRVKMIAEESLGDRTVVVCMRDVTERKLLQDRLASFAWVDALTGVGNRRAVDAALENAWCLVERERSVLSLALIDIDHFKGVNDTHGHQAGDHCIRHITGEVLEYFRPSEVFVGRYGGDELVVLLPGYDETAVVEATTKICLKVAESALPEGVASIGRQLTISCGATTAYGSQIAPPLTKSDFVRAADQALYIAKHRGRNQAAFAPLIANAT